MIRDQEIKRLVLYGRGLGIRIRIANYSWDDAGEFTSEPKSEININKRVHTSKTELILTLLHEICHNVHFSYTKEPIPPAAYETGKQSKAARKKLYDYEVAGIDYMLNVATELQLKIPKWKVEKAMEQDKYPYEVFWRQGRYPTRTERKEKNKELNLKYNKGKA